MKVLIAPDSFKESLSALDVALNIESGIKKARPDIECIVIPMADGGEGTVKSIIHANGGNIIRTSVFDPLRREIKSLWGLTVDGQIAVVEMAAASGLELLTSEERNPLMTTSYGTGQLLVEAIKRGVKKIILGLGGSATNDGGAGLAEALGVKFYNVKGELLHPEGGNLDQITEIDSKEIIQGLDNVEIIIATDVNNKMCGPEGASRIYGPQKGADVEMVEKLDKNLRHYGQLLEQKFGIKIMETTGTGAAGGLAASLLACSNATIKPGFEVVCQLTGFEKKCQEADLVITGEGKIDVQTYFGKTPAGVLKIARKYNKPVIALAGSYEVVKEEYGQEQFDAVVPIVTKPCTLEYALKNAPELIRQASERIIRLMIVSGRFI